MLVPFILVALIYAVSTNDAQESRDIVVVPPPGSVTPAPGSAVPVNANGIQTLSLDSNGGFAGFTGNSQTLPSGGTIVQVTDGENSPELLNCPCGCSMNVSKNVVKQTEVAKDQRCSRVNTTPIRNGNIAQVRISSPTAFIGSHAVICSCGCFISTAEGTSGIIFVDDFNCRRDPAGSVDGLPVNCTCGCRGQSPLNTIYEFGRSPICENTTTTAGGSTVIINDVPDLNGVPLGLFPFTNVRNGPFGYGSGFGGFPGGFGGIPGGFGGIPGGFGGIPGSFGGIPGGFGGIPGGFGVVSNGFGGPRGGFYRRRRR